MKPAGTVEQIRGRIFNPSPTITHCPCGRSLGECLRIAVSGEGCRTLDTHYQEFLEMVPDWFLLIGGIALCEAEAAYFGGNLNSEPWD